MKKVIPALQRLITILVMTFLFANQGFASHAMGTDIEFTCVSGNTYEFTVSFYRDCAGVSAPASATIYFNSPSGCGTTANVVLNQIPGTGNEVSPLCPSQLGNSTCSGGSLPGVQQWQYRGQYTFPTTCSDWVVSFYHCCRNNMITNLNSPGSWDLYVEAKLDMTLTPCNSSPSFSSLPVPYICANQPFCYNHGAVDPDGDSLVYHLVNALDGPYPGTNIAYNAPTSKTYPITTVSGTIQFDSLTGSMCITPNGTQVAVVVVEVEEYRNGVLIGSTMRDLQIVVQNCSNVQPNQQSNGIANLSGGVLTDSNSVEVCPGDSISFDLTYSDSNPTDNITVTTNIAASLPGATSAVFGSNPAILTIGWRPTAADIGFHVFTVTIQDDGCPILGSQVFSYDIRVLDGTYAGPDLNYCPAGGPVTIYANGGTTFTWSDLGGGGPTGLSCSVCQSPQASPSSTQTYVVQSDLSATCKNRDTVTVNRVPDFNLTIPSNPTICRYGTTTLTSNAGPGTYAPYAWLWSPGGTLSNTAISNPIANPLNTTTYYTTVTSSAGCRITDSVTVNISGVAPQVDVQDMDTICENETVNLSTLVFQDCDTTSQACSGPVSQGTIGSGVSSTSTYGPWYQFTTSRYSNRRQMIFAKDELDAMGFAGGGKISSIALNVSSVGSINPSVTDVEIKMGCTTMDEWSSSPYSFVNGLTTVKNTFTSTPTTGWNTLNFDYPYMWDGQSNLILEICVADTQNGSSSTVYYTCSSPAKYRTLYYNYYNNPNACTYATGTRTSCRPDVRFTFCEALPSLSYSWSPGTGLSNASIPNPSATVASTTTYTLNVTDGPCVGSDYVTITAGPDFPVTVLNDTTICKNNSVNLNTLINPTYGPFTYDWAPNSFISDTSVQNPTVTPELTTTYKVAVKGAGGCEVEDSAVVTVGGVAPNVMPLADTICPNGTGTLSPQINQGCGPSTYPCSSPLTTGTIGNGTSSTTVYGPHYMNTVSQYRFRQQIILSRDELETMGFVGGGIISELAYYYTTAGDSAHDIRISMGCTTRDEWLTSPYNFDNGLTLVKGPFDYIPTVGWNTWTLDNPYSWDGQSNIIIEICRTTVSYGIGSSVQYGCLSPVKYRHIYNATTLVTGGCSYPTGTRTSCRPNVQLSYCQDLPSGITYSWSPSTGLSNPNIANPNVSIGNNSVTYTLNVDDGNGCAGVEQVTVAIDSTNYAVAASDSTCVIPGNSTQLNSSVFGPTPIPTLSSCGTNGTSCSQTPTSAVVGSGTFSSSFYGPFYGTYGDVRQQYLFTASELSSAGLVSGTITELAWNVITKNSGSNFRNFTISLGCTSDNTLSVATGWLPTTQVYNSNYSSSVGWNSFSITPFDWDGTSNIVVEICYNMQNNGAPGADAVQYTTGLPVQFMQAYSNNNGANGCNLAPTGAYTSRGNIQFTICPPPPLALNYTWTPGTSLSNPNVDNPVATPSTPTSYVVTVSGGNCTLQDTVFVNICNNTLPVELIEFNAEKIGETSRVYWSTQTEMNTSHFIVQRSTDKGATFTDIGQRQAAGNSSGVIDYELIDFYPERGSNQYRLRMVDLDGRFDYSDAVEVFFDGSEGAFRVYPNPVGAAQELKLSYYSETGNPLQVKIVDLLGRAVFQNSYDKVQGAFTTDINPGNISQGTYMVILSDGARRHTRKLVIK